MIIFGTRGVTYSKEKGQFHCPECAAEGGYNHKRVRRFFTLYFIPLIPMDLHGEYIECEHCKATYRMDVLDFDPQAQAAQFDSEFHRAVKRVMVQMMMADGVVEEEEITTIQQLFREITNTDISHAEVQQEIAAVERDGLDVGTSLANCAAFLNEEGKEMVVRAAFTVAAADGIFQEEEKVMMSQIAAALGMSTAHLRGVMSSVLDSHQGQLQQ